MDIKEKFADKYDILGVRFEKLERVIGSYCANSKSNIERVDVRDFPSYESEEYKNMTDCNGICCYDYDFFENHIDLEEVKADGYKVYLIGGDSYEEGEDLDEMIIPSGIVLEILA